eukprot:3705171-Prymnesium_polylepis.1
MDPGRGQPDAVTRRQRRVCTRHYRKVEQSPRSLRGQPQRVGRAAHPKTQLGPKLPSKPKRKVQSHRELLRLEAKA